MFRDRDERAVRELEQESYSDWPVLAFLGGLVVGASLLLVLMIARLMP